MTNMTCHGWPQFATQMLQIPQKYQVCQTNCFHVMDFTTVKLFCVTNILDCIQKVQNSINLQTKHPNALSKFLFIQQQYPQFHSTSVHGVFLFLPKFCKAVVQISSPPSCLKAGQIFVKRQNCQILQFAGRAA